MPIPAPAITSVPPVTLVDIRITPRGDRHGIAGESHPVAVLDAHQLRTEKALAAYVPTGRNCAFESGRFSLTEYFIALVVAAISM